MDEKEIKTEELQPSVDTETVTEAPAVDAEHSAEKTNIPALERALKKVRRAEKDVKGYQYFLIRLAVFLIVLWVLLFVIVGVMRMPSTDMYPRLDSGDLVLYYRLDKDVRAQDVIVIEKEVPTLTGKQLMILRVVAVEGDTVEISEGDRLIINGNPMVESNIFYSTPAFQSSVEYPVTLGEGECFVLADSRKDGTDSRFFGPVQKDEILGTVITIVRRNNL